jgi:hypothetical protein
MFTQIVLSIASIFSSSVRSVRPSSTHTKKAIKAKGRKNQAQASRKANRARKCHNNRKATKRVYGPVVSRRHRLACIVAKQQRKAAKQQPAVSVQVRTPRPIIKRIPLSMQRPSAPRSFTRAVRVDKQVTKTEVVVPKQVLVLSLEERQALRATLAAAKVERTALQQANIAAKAKAKAEAKAKTVVAPNAQSKTKKAGKATSQRTNADMLVVAGPTADDDYGWAPMSIEQFSDFIYGEATATPTPAVSITPRIEPSLYDLVVNALVPKAGTPDGVGQAPHNTPNTQPMNKPALHTITNPKVIVRPGKMPLYPSKAYTKKVYDTPQGFYALETGRMPIKKGDTNKGTYTFVSSEGTLKLMRNSHSGVRFINNSHIRAFSYQGSALKSFNDFLRACLDAQADAINEQARASEGECHFLTVYNDTIVNGGMSNEEALEVALSMNLQQPIKYYLLEAEQERTANGTINYVYDVEAVMAFEEEWSSQGYRVIGIQSTLRIGAITADNIRIDGNAPCVPTSFKKVKELEESGITAWDETNCHLAVSEVSDIDEWLTEVLPTVKEVSLSFNNITPLEERGGLDSVVHCYTLTTDTERYEEFGIEVSSLPAWTVNLWTTTPIKGGMVPQSQAHNIAGACGAFNTRNAGTAPSVGASALASRLAGKTKAQGKGTPNQPKATYPSNPVPAGMKHPTVSIPPVFAANVPLEDVIDVNQAPEEEELFLNFNTDEELCMKVILSDVLFPANYLESLSTTIEALGIQVCNVEPNEEYLGSYNNGVINIDNSLNLNQRIQVLVHELVHAVMDGLDAAVVEAITDSWLSAVGHNVNAPEGVSTEEQFAYSFMEYIHDAGTLEGFLVGLATNGDAWEECYNSLELTVTGGAAEGPAVSGEPISIVTGTEEEVAPNPLVQQLLNADSALIVVTDAEGTLPFTYHTAFPEVRLPKGDMGDVAVTSLSTDNALYAVRAVRSNDGGSYLDMQALRKGLEWIAAKNPGQTFVCERGLGFGVKEDTTPFVLGLVRQILGKANVQTISLPAMEGLLSHWKADTKGVLYPQCDFSLWKAGLMKGTAIQVVPLGEGAIFKAAYDQVTGMTMTGTLEVLNDDASINMEALQQGLAELEAHITAGEIPMPIYCYTTQYEAVKTLSVEVVQVEYVGGKFLPSVKVGVLDKSPIKGRSISSWYLCLLEDLDSEKGGLCNALNFTNSLFSKAFEVAGMDVSLAPYALPPLPLGWLQKGIVLVIPGKDAKGLIPAPVKYEELIDKGLLEALINNGIRVYTAEWTFDKKQRCYVMAPKTVSVHGILYGIYPFPEGLEGDEMLELRDPSNPYETLYNNIIYPNDNGLRMGHTLDQYMQKHVLDTLQYLIDTQGVGVTLEYVSALLPKLINRVTEGSGGKERYWLSVYNQRNAASYYLEFTPNPGAVPGTASYLSSRHCTVFTGRAERHVNAITNLSGFPDSLYDGATMALSLAISAASGRGLTQDVFEGYLAGTSNLWARDQNYGLELTTIRTEAGYSLTDTLKSIIDSSGKTISSTHNQNVDAKGISLGRERTARWPYFMPQNASLDLFLMDRLMRKGQLTLCDKYAMDRIITEEGSSAMLASKLTPQQAAKLKGYNPNKELELDMELELALDPTNGNMLYSVCWPIDKASKALNRPSQFHAASQADGWKESLEWCPLHTDLGQNRRASKRGFKRTVIAATTDFLSPGSGAAAQHPAASAWSFKVNGSVQATLDWHQVPAVQENRDKEGKHLPGLRCHSSVMGPNSESGPSGKDREGKEVPASKWFCRSFANNWLAQAIENAMWSNKAKKEHRIYRPGEEMVVLFDKIYTKDGVEKTGFFPNGNTPGLPSARIILFANTSGQENVIITGYKFLPLERGERLQVTLQYATVTDTTGPSNEWSGAKARGLGMKYIISHDATIEYPGATANYNGQEVSLDALYKSGAIHVTSEGLKGNYAFLTGFAAAHGCAVQTGPYLRIDATLPDGTPNPHYIAGDERMVSDMTDTNSYFYQWVREATRLVRMRKVLSADIWQYILECNKKSLDANGNLPGVTATVVPSSICWDTKEANGAGPTDDSKAVIVEYEVQVVVYTDYIQVEVANPGACTGSQGMTAEQAVNLEIMSATTSHSLWANGAKSREGVENAVLSAEVHANIEAGIHMPNVFVFNPYDESHRTLMEGLLYNTSSTGARTIRPVEEFYVKLSSLFGGAVGDTTALWKEMVGEDSNEYLDNVRGIRGHIEGCLDNRLRGLGLCIQTVSEESGDIATTYIDPTVFLSLGAFESVLIAADPKTHSPARRVKGAATGITHDIHKALLNWCTTEYWSRKGVTGITHAINSRLRGSMLAWIGVNTNQPSMMNARGVLGRIARIDASAGIAGKICTGIGAQYAPHCVYNAEGELAGKLPVAIIHPDCMLAKGLRHGDVIGLGRTPTVSLAFCVVKFSRTYGRMGYIHCGFDTWAKGNNGDTDGDPCNRVRVDIDYHTALSLNKSALGMGGYNVVCGDDPSGHDCADFVSFKDVWVKKALNNDPEYIPLEVREWLGTNNLKVKPLEALVNIMLPSSLLDSASKVSNHYRTNVGISYGWCSAYSAHLKEKHSYLEAVVYNLLNSAYAKQYKRPTLRQTMEILMSGEIYDAMHTGTQETVDAMKGKYPVLVHLYQCKLEADKYGLGAPMDIVEMGQHLRVMLQASAWLWRGVYEGLGLSGYSPTAASFFEAFSLALRHNGRVADWSTRDGDGKVITICAERPKEKNSMLLGEFIAEYYGMSQQIAEEIFAACLLYNGYRAIERGNHVPAEDGKQATPYENFGSIYNDVMGQWGDTNGTEYQKHSVLAGVFRRAGQGTTGVSISDDVSENTSQMIFSYAMQQWGAAIRAGKPIFRNVMLNDIATKSITLYDRLIAIATIDEGQY